MTPDDVRNFVLEQIGDRWDETNSHGVDLRTSLVTPCQTKMIRRLVRKGKLKDSLADAWIVLEELPDGNGYIVFYDDDRGEFGLASDGFENDQHPVICGYYGDFWNAFKGM